MGAEFKYVSTECMDLLVLVQQGDKNAEYDLLEIVRKSFMSRRVSRYLNKNRQVDNEDIKQEFMIGVAINLHRADLMMGDPIEYLLHQGLYRVRSYMRKHIVQGTMQICEDCGHKSRLNQVQHGYQCKKCGSMNVGTHEINDHNETALSNIPQDGFEGQLVESLIMSGFKQTLTPGTNLYSLFELMESGIDRDNPLVKNYIKEIATMWGGCSTENVMQNIKKLRIRLEKWMKEIDKQSSVNITQLAI